MEKLKLKKAGLALNHDSNLLEKSENSNGYIKILIRNGKVPNSFRRCEILRAAPEVHRLSCCWFDYHVNLPLLWCLCLLIYKYLRQQRVHLRLRNPSFGGCSIQCLLSLQGCACYLVSRSSFGPSTNQSTNNLHIYLPSFPTFSNIKTIHGCDSHIVH